MASKVEMPPVRSRLYFEGLDSDSISEDSVKKLSQKAVGQSDKEKKLNQKAVGQIDKEKKVNPVTPSQDFTKEVSAPTQSLSSTDKTAKKERKQKQQLESPASTTPLYSSTDEDLKTASSTSKKERRKSRNKAEPATSSTEITATTNRSGSGQTYCSECANKLSGSQCSIVSPGDDSSEEIVSCNKTYCRCGGKKHSTSTRKSKQSLSSNKSTEDMKLSDLEATSASRDSNSTVSITFTDPSSIRSPERASLASSSSNENKKKMPKRTASEWANEILNKARQYSKSDGK